MVGKAWQWECQEDGYIVPTVRKHSDVCLPILNFQIIIQTPRNDKRTFTNVLSSGALCPSLSTWIDYVSLPYFLPPALFSVYEEEEMRDEHAQTNACRIGLQLS